MHVGLLRRRRHAGGLWCALETSLAPGDLEMEFVRQPCGGSRFLVPQRVGPSIFLLRAVVHGGDSHVRPCRKRRSASPPRPGAGLARHGVVFNLHGPSRRRLVDRVRFAMGATCPPPGLLRYGGLGRRSSCSTICRNRIARVSLDLSSYRRSFPPPDQVRGILISPVFIAHSPISTVFVERQPLLWTRRNIYGTCGICKALQRSGNGGFRRQVVCLHDPKIDGGFQGARTASGGSAPRR